VKIDVEQIKSALTQEVLKREVIEGDKFEEARKKINKASSKLLKTKTKKETLNLVEDAEQEVAEEIVE